MTAPPERGFHGPDEPFVRAPGGRYEARVSLTPIGRMRAQAIAEAMGIKSPAGWLIVTTMVLNEQLNEMMNLGGDLHNALNALQRELGVEERKPTLELAADPNTDFMLICRDCGDGDEATHLPFANGGQRDAWASAHARETAHDRYYAWEQTK